MIRYGFQCHGTTSRLLKKQCTIEHTWQLRMSSRRMNRKSKRFYFWFDCIYGITMTDRHTDKNTWIWWNRRNLEVKTDYCRWAVFWIKDSAESQSCFPYLKIWKLLKFFSFSLFQLLLIITSTQKKQSFVFFSVPQSNNFFQWPWTSKEERETPTAPKSSRRQKHIFRESQFFQYVAVDFCFCSCWLVVGDKVVWCLWSCISPSELILSNTVQI